MNESNSRIESLLEYLNDNPDDSFSQYALALEYDKLGNRTKSIALLEQLLMRAPDYLAGYYQLGKLYEADGKAVEATDIYERGIIVAQRQKNMKMVNELRAAIDMME